MVNMADIEGKPTMAPSSTVARPGPTSPTSETSAGTKRKREARGGPKFYAVRVGRKPGIYHSWAECLEQVRGFPKAIFKSFLSLTEAQRFVKDDGFAGESGVAGPGKSTDKWYGVRCGRIPGVYSSWAEVLEQITGWKNPKHKVFKTRIEAELFVKDGEGQSSRLSQRNDGQGDGYPTGVPIENSDISHGTPAAKKARLNGKSGQKGGAKLSANGDSLLDAFGVGGSEYGPDEAPLPPGTEDGFDSFITLDQTTGSLRYKSGAELTRAKYEAVRPAHGAPVRIYTDGSSLSNGRVGAVSGVGVYFGPGDRRNISEGLPGVRQTNQRAELTAILRALEVAPKDRRIIIFSDSNYAIKCTNEWFQKWRENGWVNASRKPVENRDLILKIIDNLEERQRMNYHRQQGFNEEDSSVESPGKPGPWERGPAGVKFVWVKGHDKNEGNNAADELATAGAREARELIAGDYEYS